MMIWQLLASALADSNTGGDIYVRITGDLLFSIEESALIIGGPYMALW